MLTSQRGLCKGSEDLWITHRDTLEIEGADSFFGVKPKVNGGVKVIKIHPVGSVDICCLSSFNFIFNIECTVFSKRCKTDTRMCFYT